MGGTIAAVVKPHATTPDSREIVPHELITRECVR